MSGSVYFFAADNGTIKIGYSRNCESRLATLRKMNTASLRVIGTIPGQAGEARSVADGHGSVRQARLVLVRMVG